MKPLMFAAAALALVLPGLAWAQSTPLPAAQEDGQDLASFKAKRVEGFMRMDTDHDGRVSLAELTAFQAGRKHGGGKNGSGKHGEKAFHKIDANGDGFLTADEIGRAAEHRFHKLDSNGDGKVVASERAAAHHGRGGDQPTGF
jgi:hypothetical protein